MQRANEIIWGKVSFIAHSYCYVIIFLIFVCNFLGDSSGLALHYQAASFQIVFRFEKYIVTYLLLCYGWSRARMGWGQGGAWVEKKVL